MVKKLHIGNLAYTATDEALKSVFSKFGTVEAATVVKDRTSGRSKGFGFVEMSTDEEAAQAIDKLNKSEFEGRTMFVSESRPSDPNRSAGLGNRSGGSRFGDKPDRRPRTFRN